MRVGDLGRGHNHTLHDIDDQLIMTLLLMIDDDNVDDDVADDDAGDELEMLVGGLARGHNHTLLC